MITIQKTTNIDFDNEGERRRIMTYQEGRLRDQLLALLDAFEKGDLKGANVKYYEIMPHFRSNVHWRLAEVLGSTGDLLKGVTVKVITE